VSQKDTPLPSADIVPIPQLHPALRSHLASVVCRKRPWSEGGGFHLFFNVREPGPPSDQGLRPLPPPRTGTSLPYLDGAKYFISQDTSARATAIRSGRVDVEFRQFLSWLWDAVRLDFGNSLWTGAPVTEEIWIRLPVTSDLRTTRLLRSGTDWRA
jgi:hypothetical protein